MIYKRTNHILETSVYQTKCSASARKKTWFNTLPSVKPIFQQSNGKRLSLRFIMARRLARQVNISSRLYVINEHISVRPDLLLTRFTNYLLLLFINYQYTPGYRILAKWSNSAINVLFRSLHSVFIETHKHSLLFISLWISWCNLVRKQ